MPKTEKQQEKERAIKPDCERKCAPAGDDADTTHLRAAKRAYNRQVERAAKRQFERQVAA